MSSSDDAQRLEGQLTRIRIKELRDINRRIFQDLPEMGFTGVRPGVFRETNTSPTRDWIKQRHMEGLPP